MILEAPKIKKSLVTSIEKVVGFNGYSLRSLDRFNYSRDSNFKSVIQIKYHKVEALPDIIVWPTSVEQIQKLVLLANRHEMPIVPYGAGSGVCGGTVPIYGGIVIDLKKLRQLIKIDANNLLATCEAGMMGLHLENELQRKGFTLGHFPSSILCASLGGYLAARSAGQASSRYGKIEDMVRSLEIVTGKGEIVETRDVSNSNGLDLNQIFLGSEGTLGLITKTTLRIYPTPSHQSFFSIRFRNMKTGIEAIRRCMQGGLKPSVIRLYDELDTLLLLSHKSQKKHSIFKGILNRPKQLLHSQAIRNALRLPKALNLASNFIPTGCLLIVVQEGHECLLQAEKKVMLEICKSLGGEDLGEAPARLWHQNRYNVSYKASPIFYSGAFTDTIEVATTWDKIFLLYKEMCRALAPHALVMAHLSHVYTEGGSLYFTFVAPLKGLKDSETLYDLIWDKGMKACQKVGGVISHHHGIGRLKVKYMAEEWGGGLDLMREVKEFYDPKGIMNPGKLLPSFKKKGMKKAV